MLLVASGMHGQGLLPGVMAGNVPAATQSATPSFFPPAGAYFGTQSIALATVTPGAVICWTDDGTTPAAATPGTCSAGTTYTGPVTVAATATVKALATKSGLTNSPVASAAYTISAPPSAPAYVSECHGDGVFVTTINCSITASIGDTFAIFAEAPSGVTITSVTDSVSGTLTATATVGLIRGYVYPNATAGSHTFTVNVGSATNPHVSVFQYSGAAASPVVGSSTASKAAVSGTSLSTGNITTTTVNNVIIVFANAGSTGASFAASSSPVAFTARRTNNSTAPNLIFADGAAATVGSYAGAATFTAFVAIDMIAIVLKP